MGGQLSWASASLTAHANKIVELTWVINYENYMLALTLSDSIDNLVSSQ